MPGPGFDYPFDLPQSWLPDEYAEYVPTSGAAPIDVAPVVEQTYLLVAQPYDPFNYNLLLWTDDPSASVWTGTATYATSQSDPDGGTNAWKILADDDADDFKQYYTPEFKTGQYAARLWFRAAGASEDYSSVRIKLTAEGGARAIQSYKWVSGILPTFAYSEVSKNLTVGGLSQTEWSEIEVVWGATISVAPHYLELLPGTAGHTSADIITFRPQFQTFRTPDARGLVTTDVRKTEEVNGPDGAPGQTTTVYISNNGYASHSTDTPADRQFPAALLEPYQLRVAPFMGDDLAPKLTPNYGEILLANADGQYDYLLDYSWDNRTITLYFGLYEDAFADFKVYSVGTARDIEATQNTLTIRYADKMAEIDKNLQSLEYKGLGMAVRCDGVGDYVGAGAVGNLWTLEDDLTVEAFIRSYSDPGNTKMVLIDKSGTTAGEEYNRNYSLRWDCQNNRLEYEHEYGSGPTAVTLDSNSNSVPSAYKSDGLWHHYAFKLDRSEKRIDFYVDGEPLPTYRTYTNEVTGAWRGGCRLGRDTDTTTWDLEADCAELRLWRTLRTNDEIKKYADRGLTDTEAEGLTLLWRLNEGTGNYAYNEQFRSVWHAAGRFDGVDDGAYESSASTITIATEFTIAVWFQFEGNSSTNGYIFGQGNWGSVAQILARTGSSGGFQWQVASSTGTTAYPGTGLSNFAGKLYCAVLTYNDTNGVLTSYVNYDEDVRTWAYDRNSGNWNLNQLAVGSNAGATSNFFNGQVYQAAIWSRCLTASQVSDLNDDAELDLSDTALEAAFTFVGNWDDSTSNGRDLGTVTGAVLLNSHGTLNGSTSTMWVGSGEGGLDLLDKYVPTVTGRCNRVEPVLVDPINFVYQIAEGPLRQVTAVYEGGDLKGHDESTDADIWSYTFPGSNTYVVNLEAGLLRAETPPSYPVTVDVKGDWYGGEYRADAGFIVKRILTRRGGLTWPDDFDEASFDEIDKVSAMGIYSGIDNLNMIEAINRVMGSIHGAAFFNRAAQLKVVQVPAMDGSETASFEITSSEILYNGIEVRPIIPTWRETILYSPYWRTLSDQEVVGAAAGDKADLAKPFRSVSEFDTYVRDNWKGSQEAETETLLAFDAAASREAVARFERFSVPRRVFEITLPMGMVNINVGAVGTLIYNRFGIVPEGKTIFVVQLEEDLTSKQVRILAWC